MTERIDGEYQSPYEYTDAAAKVTPGSREFDPHEPLIRAAEELKRREEAVKRMESRGGRAGV
ncbi:hypothetical protein HY946_00180 [Candidatus Gottesmanbacteria bacterium]|nr:hypothetical protein [Candidatus Gottesmanbacteria bacterium]